MDRQHFTRRIVLGAAVVGLAVLGLGQFNDALAAPVGEGSKKTFKDGCGQMGGVFVDSPKDNLTACFYDDGSKHVCDTNGSQCTYYPPPKKAPSVADPILDSPPIVASPVEPALVEEHIASGVDMADVPLIADDTQTVTPVEAPLEAIAETPVEAPVPLTEEPMAAEASAEQP